MKILNVTNQYNNDFSAILICEHCNHEQKLTTGYNDANYHNNVMPTIKCQSCGLCRTDSPPCNMCHGKGGDPFCRCEGDGVMGEKFVLNFLATHVYADDLATHNAVKNFVDKAVKNVKS